MIHTTIKTKVTISLTLSELKEIMRLVMLDEVQDGDQINLTIHPNGDCQIWHPSKELVVESVRRFERFPATDEQN